MYLSSKLTRISYSKVTFILKIGTVQEYSLQVLVVYQSSVIICNNKNSKGAYIRMAAFSALCVMDIHYKDISSKIRTK